jgi:hypothetical protein
MLKRIAATQARKELHIQMLLLLSGQRDSNSRTPVSKTGPYGHLQECPDKSVSQEGFEPPMPEGDGVTDRGATNCSTDSKTMAD